MGYQRLVGYRDRVVSEITRSFAADHTPHEVAASFAIGVVIVTIPTAGLAIVIFAVLAYFFEQASKLALFSTLIVFNPVVKWGVYGASYWLGTLVLGPVPGGSITSLSLAAGPDIVIRQLLGNVLIAVGLGLLSYVVVRWAVREYRRRQTPSLGVVPGNASG